MKKIWRGYTAISHFCHCGRMLRVEAPFSVQYFPIMHIVDDRERGSQLTCHVVPPQYIECRRCQRHFTLNEGFSDDYQDKQQERHFLSQKKRNLLLRGAVSSVNVEPFDVERV